MKSFLVAGGVLWVAWGAGVWLGGPPVSAALADSAGAVLFQEKGCVACHGEHLQGSDKGPNLRGVARRLTHEKIERQIKEGGQNMPPFGEILEAAEVKSLVEYLGKQKEKAGKGARPWASQASEGKAAADSLRE